jgi:photosystem II stability/assembly factor-like uncharacterized protein
MLSTPVRLAVLAATFLLLSSANLAAAPKFSPIMPLAYRSLLLDLAQAESRVVAVGERGHILYSDDAGGNWTQARVPTTRMLTSVYFSNAKRGWAAGHDGLILVTDDGGETWRIQRDGLAVQYQKNLELRETAHRRLGELEQRLETENNEETRAQLELDLEEARTDLEDADLALEEKVFTSPLMDIWFQNINRGWAVGAFGTLVVTEDSGQHWVNGAEELDNPDELHLNAITGDGKGRVFIAGEGGVMFRSLNGGASWESLEPFYGGSWFGAVYNSRSDALFIFGLRGNLYRSTDFGTTWEPLLNDNTSTLAGGSASPQGEIVIVGGVGTVLWSADGGLSFRRGMIADRLSLSSGLSLDGKLILVGQGGVKVSEGVIHDE